MIQEDKMRWQAWKNRRVSLHDSDFLVPQLLVALSEPDTLRQGKRINLEANLGFRHVS